MIWLIIGFVVCVAIIISIFCDSWNNWIEKIVLTILTLLASSFVSLLICILSSSIISDSTEFNYNMVSDTKIIALKDNQNANVSFYIMGGYVDEDLYYYYAIDTEFGYKTEKIKADKVYIKYTNNEPHIEKYEGEFTKNSTYFWGVPVNNDRYIIYCPEGTVTNEFSVDLE